MSKFDAAITGFVLGFTVCMILMLYATGVF